MNAGSGGQRNRAHSALLLAVHRLILDAIPLTPRGKTDRRALDEAIRAGIEGLPQQAC
jgi:acyl-CoA synthetase (AMP-forming)/AMP-acid ligase II